MKRRSLELVDTALLLVFLSSLSFAQTPVQAPVLELTDLQGHKLGLADYRGRVVLINFWATWCPPCRTEIPELVRWQRVYKNQGLQVIGITYPPQTRSEVQRFVRNNKVNYPIALGTEQTKALFTSSDVLPTTIVIDDKGNVHEAIEGIVFADEFQSKIKPLLSNRVGTVSTEPAKPERPKIQRATITVNAEGYQPKSVKLRRGVPTRLTFIRRVAQGCGTEIVIPAYGINRPLPMNVPVVIRFTPTRTGRIKLTCGMDMFRGSLVVR